MKASLWERILFWWCDKFGHKPSLNGYQKGECVHFKCLRCNQSLVRPFDPTVEAIYGKGGD